MNSPRAYREIWFYLIAFVLALGLRLVRLAAFPLSDMEAAPALQALQVAAGDAGTLGSNPAYVILTGILFFIFDSSNFFARLVPALAGAVFTLAPLLFRGRIPSLAAVILAFFLAIDPGLVALSRQAGSSILALVSLIFAWGFWSAGARRLAAVLFAVALLSGPAIWAGLLGLGLAWAFLQSFQRGAKPVPQTDAEDSPPQLEPGVRIFAALKSVAFPFVAAFILFGTLLFLVPGGISGALEGLLEYIQGWGVRPAQSVLSGGLIFASLVFYQPLALILGLIGMVRGWVEGNRLVIGLSVWMLVALLLAVFNPVHRVPDLVWTLVPLLSLAALELSRHLDLLPEERVEVAAVIGLTVFVLVFAWLVLSSLVWTPGAQAGSRIWLPFGVFSLLAMILVLVAVGWSTRIARLGGIWGIVFILGLATLSASLAAGRLRANPTSELWSSGPYPAHVDLLAASVSDISEWSSGHVNSLPVTIYQYDSPALRWALRRHEVVIVDSLDPAGSPPVLITPFMDNPGLAASYRGQDFIWNQSPNWSQVGAAEWLRWAVIRDMPHTDDTILLWVRDNLFLDKASDTIP